MPCSSSPSVFFFPVAKFQLRKRQQCRKADLLWLSHWVEMSIKAGETVTCKGVPCERDVQATRLSAYPWNTCLGSYINWLMDWNSSALLYKYVVIYSPGWGNNHRLHPYQHWLSWCQRTKPEVKRERRRERGGVGRRISFTFEYWTSWKIIIIIIDTWHWFFPCPLLSYSPCTLL